MQWERVVFGMLFACATKPLILVSSAIQSNFSTAVQNSLQLVKNWIERLRKWILVVEIDFR